MLDVRNTTTPRYFLSYADTVANVTSILDIHTQHSLCSLQVILDTRACGKSTLEAPSTAKSEQMFAYSSKHIVLASKEKRLPCYQIVCPEHSGTAFNAALKPTGHRCSHIDSCTVSDLTHDDRTFPLDRSSTSQSPTTLDHARAKRQAPKIAQRLSKAQK
jgi:hypothetical protein